MSHAVRRLVLTVALAALGAANGYGQEPDSPPPAQLGSPCAAPGGAAGLPCPLPPVTGPLCAPAPPACAPYEDRNGPLLWSNPLLDPPGHAGPGLLGLVEVEVLKPTFRGHLNLPVAVGGGVDVVTGRFAPLDWTAAPRVDLGYRLGAGFGEFLISYRNITSQGSATAADFDPAGLAAVRTRLNVNVIDLLYANHEPSLGPHWDMRWDVGARFLGFYLGSQAAGPSLEQRVSSNYLAGGVKAGLGLFRNLETVPGLALGARLNGAYLLGQMQQSFEEVLTPAGAAAVGGAERTHAGQTVWLTDLQAGVTYAPEWGDGRLRFEAGYQLEYWYSITEALANRGNLTGQGVYFRFTYNY